MKRSELRNIIREEIGSLLEKVIRPDMSFVTALLNKSKSKLLSCKTNNQCDDVLNNIFNDYWILVDTSTTTDESCLVPKWSIDTASAIPTSQSPDGSMVKIILGYDFAKKIMGIQNSAQWKLFVDAFRMVLEHEYVHKVQTSKMPIHAIEKTWDAQKVEDNKKYLSIPQEIMSFAGQAVRELQANGYTRNDIINAIRNPSKVKETDSDIFYTYRYFFKISDKPMRRFLKNMYEYIT